MATGNVKVVRNGMHNLKAALHEFNGAVEVGVFGGKYPNGLSVASNAAIHNFGTKHIPARPFMTNAADTLENEEVEVGKILSHSLKTGVNPNERLGALAAQTVRDEIRNGDFKALDPKTIKRKKSSTPLIDTGKLIQAVTFRDAE